MTDEVIVEEQEVIIPRVSGQDIGNPNPPQYLGVEHEGHKADADSWLRSKNKDYRRKRARQLINTGSEDKSLYAILQNHNKRS